MCTLGQLLRDIITMRVTGGLLKKVLGYEKSPFFLTFGYQACLLVVIPSAVEITFNTLSHIHTLVYSLPFKHFFTISHTYTPVLCGSSLRFSVLPKNTSTCQQRRMKFTCCV